MPTALHCSNTLIVGLDNTVAKYEQHRLLQMANVMHYRDGGALCRRSGEDGGG